MIIKREIIQQQEIKLRTVRVKELEELIENQQNEPIKDSFFYEINKDENKSYLLKLTFDKEISEDDNGNESPHTETTEEQIKQDDINNNRSQEDMNKQLAEDNSAKSVVAKYLNLPKIENNKDKVEESPEEQNEKDHGQNEQKSRGFVEISVVVALNGIFHEIKESKTRYNEKLQELIALLAYKKCLTSKTLKENNLELKEVEQEDIDSTINYLDFFKSENIQFDIEDIYTFRNTFDIKSISSIVTHEEKLCFAISILHMRVFSVQRYNRINGKDYAAVIDRFINSYEDDFYKEFETKLTIEAEPPLPKST